MQCTKSKVTRCQCFFINNPISSILYNKCISHVQLGHFLRLDNSLLCMIVPISFDFSFLMILRSYICNLFMCYINPYHPTTTIQLQQSWAFFLLPWFIFNFHIGSNLTLWTSIVMPINHIQSSNVWNHVQFSKSY